MHSGLYISIPFCRSKCTYCNFASGVFSPATFSGYVRRVCSDLDRSFETASRWGGRLAREIDSVYLGGGTPTLLETGDLETIFAAISRNFSLEPGAEVTVECAPGTLETAMLEAFRRCGVNRVSLGVQSFIDSEAAGVGRLHQSHTVTEDVRRLRDAGISNINIDLIAGLPKQTPESWEASVQRAIELEAPHVSVYMLEVDDDSRLGREVLAGGRRYHAHFTPDDDAIADSYGFACQSLEAAGIRQYEISNFARAGCESRHNLKYWTRQPYAGFGVDAHSMLPAAETGSAHEAIRLGTPDSLEAYLQGGPPIVTTVSAAAALEEAFFLGLRLNRGVDLAESRKSFGEDSIARHSEVIEDLAGGGMLERDGEVVRLTPRGRLVSNEVFERFLSVPAG